MRGNDGPRNAGLVRRPVGIGQTGPEDEPARRIGFEDVGVQQVPSFRNCRLENA